MLNAGLREQQHTDGAMDDNWIKVPCLVLLFAVTLAPVAWQHLSNGVDRNARAFTVTLEILLCGRTDAAHNDASCRLTSEGWISVREVEMSHVGQYSELTHARLLATRKVSSGMGSPGWRCK